MNEQVTKIRLGLSNIVIFRDILKTKVIKKLIKFLEVYDDNNKIKVIDYYSDFLYELFKYDLTIGDYILSQILLDNNTYINKKIKQENINNYLENALKKELYFFEFISSFDFTTLFEEEYSKNIAQLENKKIDFYNIYTDHINNINKQLDIIYTTI